MNRIIFVIWGPDEWPSIRIVQLSLQEIRSVAHGVPPTVGLAICMGLDGQCGIFDELIICVRTVHVPTGYNYGNVSWDVPCTVQPTGTT